MRTIFVDKVVPGMILAQSVISNGGNILLEEKTILTNEMIESLKKWDINIIQVEEKVVRLDKQEREKTLKDNDILPLEELMPETLGLDSTVTQLPKVKLEPQEIDKVISGRVIGGGIRQRKPQAFKKFKYEIKQMEQTKNIIVQEYLATQKSTIKIMKELTNYRKVEKEEIFKIINKLVEEAITNKDILTNLTAVKNYDNYLLSHSINVCILSVLLGYAMGFDKNELIGLGEGALLHDIGMAKIPWDIWHKKGALTDDEYLQVKKHTIYGADILLDIGGLTPMAEVIAYQHHERLDGSGYPKGVGSVRIHDFSKIVAVCDVFEAMTSPRRYRKRFHGNEAISFILPRSGIKFDANVVKDFIRLMSLFAVGSLLKLNNGCIGLVVSSNQNYPLRPLVKLVRDENNKDISSDNRIIDLVRERELIIERIILPEEVNINIFKAL
ncbi:MAG: HD-GYP domain-containing protein [Candidatus Hydrogenedentota bacterium]